MTTLLTTNRIALLQRNLRITIATEIADGRSFADYIASWDRYAATIALAGWYLVGFAGHVCNLVLGRRVGWVSGEGEAGLMVCEALRVQMEDRLMRRLDERSMRESFNVLLVTVESCVFVICSDEVEVDWNYS